jgi:NADH dehydrogenase
LGGPEVSSFRDLMADMLKVIHRRRLILNIPFFLAGIMAGFFGFVQAVTGGLVANTILTRDQLRNLRRDNVVSEGAMGFDTLGISPIAAEAVMPEYLYRFRPSGQYDAIKDSARNLRV